MSIKRKENTEILICPYCEYKFTKNESYEITAIDEEEDIECVKCGNIFHASVHIDIKYSSYSKE